MQRLAATLAVGAVLLALSPRLAGTTSAAFSGSTSNASTFGADTMAAPGTPVSVHKSVVGGMVQLTWSASASSYVTGYTVQRATSPGGTYSTVASIPLGVTGFTEFTTGLTASSTPWDITAGPDGNLWFTESTGNRIGKITPTGTITEYAIPTAASSPKGITAGPDGNLWFTESAGSKIGKITPSGTITEYALTAARAPQYIVTGPDGALWFTQTGVNKLGRITTAGTVTEVGPVGGAGDRTNGITVSPSGDLWVTQTAVNKVARVTTAGVDTQYTLSTSGGPAGISVGPSGNLRIAQTATSKIGKVVPSADSIGVADTAAAGGPAQITPGPDGNTWYTESTGNKIASITAADAITEYAIPTAASSPQGITAGPDGNIWFTESATHKIGRYGLGLSTSWVDTTAAYDAQYYYRVVATYKSWTATGTNNMTLSLNPTSGTDSTPASPVALSAANLSSLAFPDANRFATGAGFDDTRGYSTEKIHGLQWVSPTTAFAFGSGGAILKSTNAGVDWTAQTSGTTNNLESGSCISASTCWAVGQSGTIRYTTDAGVNWVGQTAAPSVNLNGVRAVDSTHVWAVGAAGAIRFYNGTTWTAQTSASTLDVYDVSAVDATHAWAVGKTGTIQFFNGTAWTAQTSPSTKNLNSVWFVDANNGWISGDSGTILVTTNGGTTWTAQTSGTTQNLRGLCFVDASHGWAAGAAGTILFYNGTGWSAQTADAAGNIIQAVAFYDVNTGLLGTDVNNNPPIDLQLTRDGGTTWIALENQNVEVAFSPTVASGAALSSVTATVMYRTSAGNAATNYWLLASYDAGASWTYYPLAAPSGNNVTTTGTVDLSSVVTTTTRLQNLRLRYYVALGNNATANLDVIQVQVN